MLLDTLYYIECLSLYFMRNYHNMLLRAHILKNYLMLRECEIEKKKRGEREKKEICEFDIFKTE